MDSPSRPGPADPFPAVRRAWWESGPPWPGRAELRADRRSSLALAGVLTLAGVPAGLLWEALAPRARFAVTADGPVAVGRPSPELLFAVDGVFTLVMAGLGLLAGAAAWRMRRRRGVGTLLGLAAGCLLAGLVAWQLGELLGPGPSETELADVGARVTTGLDLGSPAALAVGPFLAVLVYAVGALLAPSEELDRPRPPAAVPAERRGPRDAVFPAAGRPLVDVPPPDRPGR